MRFNEKIGAIMADNVVNARLCFCIEIVCTVPVAFVLNGPSVFLEEAARGKRKQEKERKRERERERGERERGEIQYNCIFKGINLRNIKRLLPTKCFKVIKI